MITLTILPAKQNYQEALTVTTGAYLNPPRRRFPRSFVRLPSCVERQTVSIVGYYTLPFWIHQAAKYVFS